LKTPLRQPSTQPILSKTTMPEISASEYLNSLLQAYQSAEKIYTQAVSDLVAAEIRRDEASTARDEALQRLEEARAKYGPGNKAANGEQKLNKSNSFSRRKGGPGKHRFPDPLLLTTRTVKQQSHQFKDHFPIRREDWNLALQLAIPMARTKYYCHREQVRKKHQKSFETEITSRKKHDW